MSERYENRGATLAAYIMLHKPAGAKPHPAQVGRLVGEMQSRTRSAKRMAEYSCNYGLTEQQQAEAQRRLQKYEEGINRALCGVGLSNMVVRLGGDPPGTCGNLEITEASGVGFGLVIY